MNILTENLYLLPTVKNIKTVLEEVHLDREVIRVFLPNELEIKRSVIQYELEYLGFKQVHFTNNQNDCDLIFKISDIPGEEKEKLAKMKYFNQSYILKIMNDKIYIYSLEFQGALYGLATLGQIIEQKGYDIPSLIIEDGPDTGKRIVSTTLTWYAGYARIGFGTQLWSGAQWKEFIDWCFRHKINVINMVMYGFWPFEFTEYPETVMRDIRFKTWSKELSDWIELSYTHPNLIKPFLKDIIKYANERGIEIYAYIGLNSYNGGYAIEHPESRMVLSEELKAKGYVNNYDSLCPSRDDVRKYIFTVVKKIEEIGFNGIVFEESEETEWFCQCEKCRERYGSLSPNDAKHTISVELLTQFDKILNPDTIIGVRWLREPPAVKNEEYLKSWANALPERIKLFWAPGLEDDDREFIKWVQIFGKEKIWSRNCEGSGFAASMGRIPYLIPDNFPDELKNYVFQHLWNDIAQFRGAVNLDCYGINGYGFEWYGHENFFMATAQYGWNCWDLNNSEFIALSSRHFFGKENGAKFERIIQTMPCIHDTQICDTLPPFPFMPTKYVGLEGKRYLENCADSFTDILSELENILNTPGLTKIQRESINALKTMVKRMNEVAWAGIYYNRFLEENNNKYGDRSVLYKFAKKALFHAETAYDIIKETYLDSKEHMWTGVPIGEYYIPMVINEYRKNFYSVIKDNEFKPKNDVAYIFGGESLPWGWLLEWAPIIAKAKPNAAVKKGSLY